MEKFSRQKKLPVKYLLFTFSLKFHTDVFLFEGPPAEPLMDVELVASLDEKGIPVPDFKRAAALTHGRALVAAIPKGSWSTRMRVYFLASLTASTKGI